MVARHHSEDTFHSSWLRLPAEVGTMMIPLLLLFLLEQPCIVIAGAFLPTTTSAIASDSRRVGRSQRRQPTRYFSTPVDTDHLVRGEKYSSPNSTVPSAHDVAHTLGIDPPANAPPRVWKRAYQAQKWLTPLLHGTLPNSSLNVYCVWWKALSSLGYRMEAETSGRNNVHLLDDDGLTYDLLPTFTRPLLKVFRNRFPRLHHANVELRTVYLHQAVQQAAVAASASQKKVRLVTFGAGYDMRSTRLLSNDPDAPLIHAAYELDLPAVIEAKKAALTADRFLRRRERRRRRQQKTGNASPAPYLRLPTFSPVDMNDLDRVQEVLQEILQPVDDQDDWHTIFLFEAVLIYLQPGIPAALLEVCANATCGTSSLCFADRLEHIPGGNFTAARKELARRGWHLVDWLPKPGLARHMGRAERM